MYIKIQPSATAPTAKFEGNKAHCLCEDQDHSLAVGLKTQFVNNILRRRFNNETCYSSEQEIPDGNLRALSTHFCPLEQPIAAAVAVVTSAAVLAELPPAKH